MNRFQSQMNEASAGRDPRQSGPQPIGKVLAELLAAYQVRYPAASLTILETPQTAVNAA
jgi:hypothetical protein